MTKQAAQIPDPRVPSGPFHDLMTKIRACKKRGTCPCLTSRSYYFEPNPFTAREWQVEQHAYLSGIDRRVVFVCESPGRRFASKNEWPPSRCWAKTSQDERFRRARKRYGFINCYITNTVKCGVRRGARHTNEQLSACRDFLIRELKLLQPLVVLAVGGNAHRTLYQDIVPRLDPPPVLFRITHYSARGDLGSKWEREFAELERLLTRLKPRSDW